MSANYISNFYKKVGIVALLLSGFTATAQDMIQEVQTPVVEEAKKFNISGSVDAYFRTNLTSNNREIDGVYNAPSTSFVNRNGFSVGMINVIASYGGEKAGFVGDLVFGPRGDAAVVIGENDNSGVTVNQAYGYWNATESVTFTLGRFNTYLGYEVISPVGNFNYSTSYMFSNGPFSHNGLKADFTIDDNWSALVAVMNPTDVTFGNPTDTYVLGAQVGYSNDSGSAYLNFRYGNEGEPGRFSTEIAGNEFGANLSPTFQADLTTGWDVSEELYLGFNATYTTTKLELELLNEELEINTGFYGIAVYPQYSFSETFALGLRGEYFSLHDDAEDSDAPSVFAATLTGQYKVGSLTIIPEFRLDATDEDNPIDGAPFTDNDNEATGSLASFVLGVVYAF